MARKPHSVFLIAETPHASTQTPGMPASTLQAWRLPLNDQDVGMVVEAHYEQQPIGTTLYVVEDTKVQGYEVGLKLTAIDDPRLDEDEDPLGPPEQGLGIERG